MAGIAVALWIWWKSSADPQPFPPPVLALFSPLLGGLSVAIAFSLIERLAGPPAAWLAALLLVALPGFISFHQLGVETTGFLLVTMVMLLAMLHAPRWSLAYGALAAAAALLIPPAGGFPLAAAAWAVRAHPTNGSGRRGRLLLALTPLLVALVLAAWLGEGWPRGRIGWHGGLDRGLSAAGTVIGDQLAPGIASPAVRFFAIADLSLILIAVIFTAWWRIARPTAADALLRRWYLAVATLTAGVAVGLVARHLLLLDSPDPGLGAVFPVAVLGVLVGVTSVTAWWPKWSRRGKGLAAILLLGWLQAAIRG